MLDGSRRWTVAGVSAWQAAAVVVAAYSLAALAVAFLTHSATARPFPEAARDLWSAAMIWTVLTAGIYGLVRRWPVSSLGYRRAVLVYGIVIVGASWVVNGAFVALHVATGITPAGDSAERLYTHSLLHLPFNAAAALALIAVFHWLRAAGPGAAREPSSRTAAKPKAPDSIPVSSGTRQFSVPVAAIELIEAADDYVVLHCDSGSHLCGERLYRLEKTLAPAGFVRVHRSALVNLDRVVALSGGSRGRLRLELSSGRSVAVSRRRQSGIRRAVT